MKNPPKHAVITAFLSRTKDRFHEYNSNKNFEERLQIVTELEGFDAVEMIYPYEVSDPALTLELLQKYKLGVAAVNVNVKAEPEFRQGGLTSKDPCVLLQLILLNAPKNLLVLLTPIKSLVVHWVMVMNLILIATIHKCGVI